MMRLIHVVPRITTEASGPAYSVMALCEALRRQGAETTLAVVGPAPDRALLDWVKVFPASGKPFRLGRSIDLNQWLQKTVAAGEVDIVHNHSLWMMPNIYPGWATKKFQIPLVVSPRGTLSRWALQHSRWRKKIMWATLQRPAIRHAACFHATAESEYEDIRRAGFPQPVCVLPNGVEAPVEENGKQVRPQGRRRLLFLGRIHPVKGVENLIRAWSVVEKKFPEWALDIVGPDDVGHAGAMKALANKLDAERVNLRGPAYGADKVRAYRASELYVLPTHSENFGMTVAEALAVGTPAIVTKGAPWAGLEKQGAGWWIDIGVDPLVSCLEDALASSPETLQEKGDRGRDWMRRDFSWDRIAEKMFESYDWLLNGGEPPDQMRIS